MGGSKRDIFVSSKALMKVSEVKRRGSIAHAPFEAA